MSADRVAAISVTSPAPELPDGALDVLLHTLGLGLRRAPFRPWRNRFVLGAGHRDEAAMEALVAAGLAELVGTQERALLRVGGATLPASWGGMLAPGDRVYRATSAGKTAAVAEARRRWAVDASAAPTRQGADDGRP